MDRLDDRAIPFELVVLGESFGQAPEVFERARSRYGPRVLAWGYQESRSQYASWLHSVDVVVSTARQEFFGASVSEAVWCGAQPILPNRLSYPEIVPASVRKPVLYDTEDELVEKLEAALIGGSMEVTTRMQQHLAEFDWSRMAPRYDARLGALASAHPGSAAPTGPIPHALRTGAAP